MDFNIFRDILCRLCPYLPAFAVSLVCLVGAAGSVGPVFSLPVATLASFAAGATGTIRGSSPGACGSTPAEAVLYSGAEPGGRTVSSWATRCCAVPGNRYRWGFPCPSARDSVDSPAYVTIWIPRASRPQKKRYYPLTEQCNNKNATEGV